MEKFMFFIEVEKLESFEKNNKWKNAVDLLYDNWKAEEGNADKLIRCLSECWYLLSEGKFLDVDYDDKFESIIKTRLLETYNYASVYFSENDKVLAVIGYMMSLFPNHFYRDDMPDETYLEYEKLGKEMLRYAAEINKEDKLIQVLYLGAINDNEKSLKVAKKNLSKIIDIYFSDKTEIERYFKEVSTMSM